MMSEGGLDEILEERVVSSRGKRNPRGVKREMSKWPIRQAEADNPVDKQPGYHIELLK